MKLVIDIPEKIYSYVNTQWRDIPKNDSPANIMCNAIIDGTPLPKGHGRLIDADALEKKMCEAIQESSAVSVTLDMFAPTIIEADKLPNNELENPFNDSRFGG